ncbi:MAG: hypothetical protein KBD53_06975 [Candidatus Omnitrophica bacterium]|nr:hypothetical protein [Candidatus Omnitrophota bacterium]
MTILVVLLGVLFIGIGAIGLLGSLKDGKGVSKSNESLISPEPATGKAFVPKTFTVKQCTFLWAFPIVFTILNFLSIVAAFAAESGNPLLVMLYFLLLPILYVYMIFYKISFGIASWLITDTNSPLLVVFMVMLLLLFGLLLGFISVILYKRKFQR